MSAKDNDWRRKNILAMGRHADARCEPAAPRFKPRTSEPTIRERQSASLAGVKRSGRRQPSMPKFNLPGDEP